MNGEPTTSNIAVFCDYENVAIGAKDAKFGEPSATLLLERILDKGKVIVRRAYAHWDRYKSAMKRMHEAAFELIEIPHVLRSGKNSADIRLVVDALDLCYTKPHVDTFVIVSGDSDFSPLVSKLRENSKRVIGLGVKNSSSDLLISICDEFIYYDDLERERREREGQQVSKVSRQGKAVPAAPGEVQGTLQRGDKMEALALVLDVADSLLRDRDDSVWGSMVKQTLKRRRPNFAETFYGYRTFNQLLEDAQEKGLLGIQKDVKSGGYLVLEVHRVEGT
jgi:uncharacterized protein (TIGR00288 family)